MPVLANKDNRPVNVRLGTGKSLKVSARGTCEVSDKELALPEIQRLVANRTFVVRAGKKAAKAEPAKATKPPEPPKKETKSNSAKKEENN